MSEANATDDNDRETQSTGTKVLLGDDHASYRDMISQTLRKAHQDVTVIEAGNFAEALQIATTHDNPSLAIVDLIMLGMDGFGGIAELRDRLPEVPIVVVSALSRPRYILQAYDHDADGFVPKTTNAMLLLGALDVVLSGGVYVPPEALEAGDGGPLEATLRAAKMEIFDR